MAQRKAVTIDFVPREVKITDTLNDILPPSVNSIIDAQGRIISKQQFERTPVPDNFETNLTEIDKGHTVPTKAQYLSLDAQLIEHFLNQFNNPLQLVRTCIISKDTNFLYVKNFPLPDGFNPDYVDLVFITSDYPNLPPVGVHVAKTTFNNEVINQIEQALEGHVFQQGILPKVEEIPNHYWICYHYRDHQWAFSHQHPTSGDSLSKFLKNFYCQLEA